MNVPIIVEVRAGSALPRGLRFSPGSRIPPFSVGVSGRWRIDAPGVTGVSMHLEFDGENVLVASAPEADVRVNGQRIGPVPTAVVPPAVVAIADVRLLIDRDDRGHGIVDCESIVAPPSAADATVTRVLPIEALLAERRDEAAEKAFFDQTESGAAIEPPHQREAGASGVQDGDDGHETHPMPDPSSPQTRRSRAKVRSVGAVLAVPLAIGAAALFVRATRSSDASAAAASVATSAQTARSIGKADAPRTRVAAEPPAAATQVALDDGRSAARPARPAGESRPAFAATHGPSAPDHASEERLAVDSVATGDYGQAARLYDGLAAAHAGTSGASTFREAARILRAKIGGAGAR